jgi:hypothetical protein
MIDGEEDDLVVEYSELRSVNGNGSGDGCSTVCGTGLANSTSDSSSPRR